APVYFYDFEEDKGTYGSLFGSGLYPSFTLKVAEVQNIDTRWEWYPAVGEMVHAGVFYKSFKDPIQRAIIDNGGADNKSLTFINVNSGTLMGMEIELRKNLAFADKFLGTNWIQYFTLVGNLTLSKSAINITDTVLINRNYIENSVMQGQSPYI